MTIRLFLSVLALAVGLGMLGWAIGTLFLAWSVRTWPTTAGRVIESRVKEVPDDEGTSFAPGVTYEYSVAGKKFAGTALSPGGRVQSGQLVSVNRTAERYPMGAAVQVRYNPARPARAYLEVWPRAFWILLLFGVAFTAAGVEAIRDALQP